MPPAATISNREMPPAATNCIASTLSSNAPINEAPLVAASGTIFVPSTAIKGVVRYDDGLRQH